MAKKDLGDASGLADMEQGLEIARAIDSPVAATTINNLAVYATIDGDLVRSEHLYREVLRLAERLGDGSSVRFIGGNLIWIDFDGGPLGHRVRGGRRLRRRLRGRVAAHDGVDGPDRSAARCSPLAARSTRLQRAPHARTRTLASDG